MSGNVDLQAVFFLAGFQMALIAAVMKLHSNTSVKVMSAQLRAYSLTFESKYVSIGEIEKWDGNNVLPLYYRALSRCSLFLILIASIAPLVAVVTMSIVAVWAENKTVPKDVFAWLFALTLADASVISPLMVYICKIKLYVDKILRQ